MVKKVPKSVANYQNELIWDENGETGGDGEYDGMERGILLKRNPGMRVVKRDRGGM